MTDDRPRSGRLLIQRFAAHLAHLLNQGEDVVELNLFHLYRTLLATLSGAGDRPTGSTYRDGLLGYQLVGVGASPEEIAQRYFESVLERPLQLARNSMFHKGHALFLAMCRRGLDRGWAEVELVRCKGGADESAIGVDPTPSDFDQVRDRLADLDTSVSPGNPAATTREARGPIHVRVGARAAEVAEELPVWRAVSCGPLTLRKLADGEEFNAFCSLVIKAVETANAHYGALVSIGLSPFDWADVLTVNTAKKISAFQSAVREDLEGRGEAQADIDTWRRVWDCRTVPGFATADDFWTSEVGRQLRAPVVARPVALSEMADESDMEGDVLERQSFGRMVESCVAEGVLSAYDAWLLSELYQGATMAELATARETEEHFRHAAPDLESYAEALRERILGHAQRFIA